MTNFLQHEMKITTTNVGEPKMLISVLVVRLTIEFGFDWFSEITFTIWDQHLKEA